MRKILSFALAWLFTVSAMALGGTDNITLANLMAQNPDANYSAAGYYDESAVNEEMTYTGQSGAVYDIRGLVAKESEGWWALFYNYGVSMLNTTTSGGYIKSITVKYNDWPESQTVLYVSDKPIDPSNKYSSDVKQIYIYSSDYEDRLNARWLTDGVYKYFYFDGMQSRFADIEIEWSEEMPAISVKTPTVTCYDDPVAVGSTVNVNCGTDGASMNIDVYVNGEKDPETSTVVNQNYYAFVLPGTTGDEVKVDAYGFKENYVNSEIGTNTWTLAAPQAARPQWANFGTYLSKVRPGETYELVSSTPGAQITYTVKYVDWDDDNNNITFDETTAPSPVSITIPETVKNGMSFQVTAVAKAEGYRDSRELESYSNVNVNKCAEPTFSIPSGSQVAAGTVLTITKAPSAAVLNYTIQKGRDYQNESTSDASVDIIIDQDMEVTATCAQSENDWENNSNTIRAKYTVIPPAVVTQDHISGANLQVQNPDGKFNATGYTDASALNPTLAFTGESGAVYTFDQVISNGTWWTLHWPYPEPKGYMYNTVSPGYITAVSFDMDYTSTSTPMEFYVSEQPITNENYGDAVKVSLYAENGAYPAWKADGLYNYFYLATAQERINDLTIEWSDQAPSINVAEPTITCNASPITAGSRVNVYTATPEATLHVDVFVNDVKHEGTEENPTSSVVEASTYSFALPGTVGDNVKVVAYATKEGLEDSSAAEATYTLEMPLAARPELDTYYGSVIPGMDVVIKSSTENATLTYKYGVSGGDEADNWTSEELTGTSPVTITVPATAKEGMQFFITATAIAEGFAASPAFETYMQVRSGKLAAPSFSLESGKEVLAGTKVTITRPEYATEIHYTINDGEAQVSAEYSVDVAITEDMTIVAWASAPAPYVDSDKVTAAYTVEKLSENQNAITPEFFSPADYKQQYYTHYEATNPVTGITYVYNGGLCPYNGGANCFYLDATDKENDQESILYNLDNPKNRKIKRFKVESTYDYGGCYVMFAKEAPITTVSEEMQGYDWVAGRLRICPADDDRGDCVMGEWIDLTTLDDPDFDFADVNYFAVWRFSQNSYVSRIIVEYDDDISVEGIETDLYGADAIYNINGVKMNTETELAPGVYIRVVNGKAQKFIVK